MGQLAAHVVASVQKTVLKVPPRLQVTVQMVLHGQSSVPPHPSEVWPQSSSVQLLGVHIVVVVVDAVVVVDVVVVVLWQTPPVPQTCEQQSKGPAQPASPSGMHETHIPVVASHSDIAQLPQEPPQPSLPQFLPAQFGVQQEPPTSLAPGGQQVPNNGGFATLGFAQLREQQLRGTVAQKGKTASGRGARDGLTESPSGAQDLIDGARREGSRQADGQESPASAYVQDRRKEKGPASEAR